ncbi:hypothetical protein, partial [Flavisolibacter nicotianae]|uniref:hypothetical protein n=1 Tax=Flavisolibacter nicotianae TaxID=2364882 RepID=UPI001968D2B7
RWQPFMRTLPFILLLTLAMVSCGQNQNFMEYASSDYYTNNEDKFGFLVFDKEKVDTFFSEYSPPQFRNGKLDSCFKRLSESQSSVVTGEMRFSKHTRSPNISDYDLAGKVLAATTKNDGEKYFGSSLHYLFFFECLPDTFQKKWVQTSLGDFEFNVTFFNRLRTKCKVFDDHIYGNTGYWDKNIKTVFRDEIFNEITADKAKLIKNCINQDSAFNDKRLQPDRDNFIHFLDQVIQKKWRLLLIDKN